MALLIATVANSSSARSRNAVSALAFDSAYAVNGRSGASSASSVSPFAAPYMAHDDEKTNRRTPGALHSARKRDRRVAVDRVGPALVQVAEGIVRQRREVHDRIESFEVGGSHVAHVEIQRGPELGGLSEVAAAVAERIEADDVMPGVAQRGSEHGPDVAVVSGDENPDSGGSLDIARSTRVTSLSLGDREESRLGECLCTLAKPRVSDSGTFRDVEQRHLSVRLVQDPEQCELLAAGVGAAD